MTAKDFYFGESQNKTLNEHYEEIIEYITSQTDNVIIKARSINDFMDIPKRKDNPDYLVEEEYQKLENGGFSILYPTKEFVEKVKDIIPTTIKELTIPVEFIGEIDFLANFPDLEKLTVSTPGIFPIEELDWITENTKIKELNLKSDHTLIRLIGQPSVSVVLGTIGGANYKGLEINCFPKDYKDYGYQVEVYKENFEDMTELDEIFQRLNGDTSSVTKVKFAKDKGYPISGVEFRYSNKPIENLNFKGLTPTEVSEIYKRLSKKIEVTKATVSQENKTYDDILRLKQLSKESNLEIDYDSNSLNASLQDFIAMRATIDYYKDLITANNLSEAEQAAYVYDLLKTWHYYESEENKSYSRNIHSIIREGKIVCGGYASFAQQLLKELGIPAIKVSVTMPDEKGDIVGHARNIIRIDDEKHNIHGIYALDITWDSDKDILVINQDDKNLVVQSVPEEMKDKIIDKYDSLSLYRYFLVPMSDYELRFPNESLPEIYETYKNGGSKLLVEEARKVRDNPTLKNTVKNSLLLEKHTTLFSPKEGTLTVERYFDASKPSLETFKKIAQNVRRAQGYTNESANYDVDRVTELHRMINDQNPDRPNLFFKDEKTK